MKGHIVSERSVTAMAANDIFADNALCRLLGIRYPICQAGMYQVAYGPLAAAVSNAGGLGVIGSAYMDPERLREEIRIARSETDKPFGVDILFANEKEITALFEVNSFEEAVTAVRGACEIAVLTRSEQGSVIVTPKAGRITTSVAVTPLKSMRPSVGMRKVIPIASSLRFTWGLWMISPTR